MMGVRCWGSIGMYHRSPPCFRFYRWHKQDVELCNLHDSFSPCAWQDLGADEVVDYTTVRFEERYRSIPFDAVLDTIGGAC